MEEPTAEGGGEGRRAVAESGGDGGRRGEAEGSRGEVEVGERRREEAGDCDALH